MHTCSIVRENEPVRFLMGSQLLSSQLQTKAVVLVKKRPRQVFKKDSARTGKKSLLQQESFVQQDNISVEHFRSGRRELRIANAFCISRRFLENTRGLLEE